MALMNSCSLRYLIPGIIIAYLTGLQAYNTIAIAAETLYIHVNNSDNNNSNDTDVLHNILFTPHYSIEQLCSLLSFYVAVVFILFGMVYNLKHGKFLMAKDGETGKLSVLSLLIFWPFHLLNHFMVCIC